REDFDSAMNRLDSVIYSIIEARRSTNDDRGDLLSMLLLAEDQESDTGKMSDEQVRDEAMTIFLAGHETSANALAWSWYLLAQHPDVEAKFHDEIDRVLGDGTAQLRDVTDLSLTAGVFAEALRLYPPVWAMGRRAI